MLLMNQLIIMFLSFILWTHHFTVESDRIKLCTVLHKWNWIKMFSGIEFCHTLTRIWFCCLCLWISKRVVFFKCCGVEIVDHQSEAIKWSVQLCFYPHLRPQVFSSDNRKIRLWIQMAEFHLNGVRTQTQWCVYKNTKRIYFLPGLVTHEVYPLKLTHATRHEPVFSQIKIFTPTKTSELEFSQHHWVSEMETYKCH